MSGDHRNLKVHGAWASVKSPTTLMSTPACVIQVGIAIQTRPRGRPEAKDCRATEARRQLLNMSATLCQVPRREGGGALAAAPAIPAWSGWAVASSVVLGGVLAVVVIP